MHAARQSVPCSGANRPVRARPRHAAHGRVEVARWAAGSRRQHLRDPGERRARAQDRAGGESRLAHWTHVYTHKE